MKLFWTNKKFNKFKDKLVENAYQAGKKGGVKSCLTIIKKYYIIRKKKETKKIN